MKRRVTPPPPSLDKAMQQARELRAAADKRFRRIDSASILVLLAEVERLQLSGPNADRDALSNLRRVTRGWHERAVALGTDGVENVLSGAEVAKRRGELTTVDGVVRKWEIPKPGCGVCGRGPHANDDPDCVPAPLWPIRGVRVDGDTVVVSVKGGNDAARWLCGELIAKIPLAHPAGMTTETKAALDALDRDFPGCVGTNDDLGTLAGIRRMDTEKAIPTTCGYCSYEEADGELIEQCATCKAADAAREGTARG